MDKITPPPLPELGSEWPEFWRQHVAGLLAERDALWLAIVTPLLERLEKAEMDAERYRWLREQHWHDGALAVVLNPRCAVKIGYQCPSGSLLDERIDAAMAQEKQP